MAVDSKMGYGLPESRSKPGMVGHIVYVPHLVIVPSFIIIMNIINVAIIVV